MSFLTPLAFLGFLLFIPVILLYLLKQRRRRIVVSTLLFWDEILRDEHSVASITKLRKILSLLLQLLVLSRKLGALFLELSCHAVERTGQLTDLVAGFDRNAVRELPGG